MRFEQYEAEDFLLEESFRNYCLGNNETDSQFWEHWANKHPEKKTVLCEAKELFFILNGNATAVQFKQDREEFQSRFDQHLNGNTQTTSRPRIVRKIFLYAGAAAAAVLLFLFASRLFLQPEKQQVPDLTFANVHVSEAGERKSFQLPDGSTVMLNSGSRIQLAENFNVSSREVSLQGEGYFNVTANKDKPFIIHTEAMDVKVLGTVFNVRAYSGDKKAETSLITGAVEVTLHKSGNKRILLQPNQKVTTSTTEASDYAVKEMAVEKTANAVPEISWTRNRLVFANNSFEEIAVELQRWYGVQLIFDNESIKQFRFTATFDQKNITQVLEALKLSRHFNYKVEESNKIRILN